MDGSIALVEFSKHSRRACVETVAYAHIEVGLKIELHAGDEAGARALADPLRTALWGAHAVAALLPETGGAPLEAAASFGRAGADAGDDFAAVAAVNAATLLVTVPSAARGLDFPNVSHVYAVGAPPGDGRDAAATYAHVAGRCGRVGQAARGVVTTLGGDDDRAALEGVLRDHFEGVEVADAAPPPSLADEPLPDGPDPPAGADADAARAYLEDVLALRDVDDGGGD